MKVSDREEEETTMKKVYHLIFGAILAIVTGTVGIAQSNKSVLNKLGQDSDLSEVRLIFQCFSYDYVVGRTRWCNLDTYLGYDLATLVGPSPKIFLDLGNPYPRSEFHLNLIENVLFRLLVDYKLLR